MTDWIFVGCSGACHFLLHLDSREQRPTNPQGAEQMDDRMGIWRSSRVYFARVEIMSIQCPQDWAIRRNNQTYLI